MFAKVSGKKDLKVEGYVRTYICTVEAATNEELKRLERALRADGHTQLAFIPCDPVSDCFGVPMAIHHLTCLQ